MPQFLIQQKLSQYSMKLQFVTFITKQGILQITLLVYINNLKMIINTLD